MDKYFAQIQITLEANVRSAAQLASSSAAAQQLPVVRHKLFFVKHFLRSFSSGNKRIKTHAFHFLNHYAGFRKNKRKSFLCFHKLQYMLEKTGFYV